MNDKSSRTTLIAGLFVLIGIILLGTLIFEFGSLRHRLRKPYTLYANFMDAQNLIQGAPVKRAGATIGEVVSSPRLVDGLKGVQVTLEIYPEFQIPVGSPLRIAPVGLMGDNQLEVGQAPQEMLKGEFYKEGSTIDGASATDLTASASRITEEAMVVMRDLRNGMADLSRTVGKLNDGVLSGENLANISAGLKDLRESIHKVDSDFINDANAATIKDALTDFRTAMANVEAASSKVDGILTKAGSAVAKVDKAMDQLGPTLKSTESATVSLKQAASALEGLLKDARTGEGLMHALLNDAGLRKDFTTLIANLKQRGILFYKDKEPKADPRSGTKPPGSR